MAVEHQKEGLHQEEEIATRKKGRCHLIKEKEAKNKNSLCGGGGSQDGDPNHPPITQDAESPQNRRNLAELPIPHVAGVPEVAKLSPECRQNVAKGSHVRSGVRGEKSPIPRLFFN